MVFDMPIERRNKYGVWSDEDADEFAGLLGGKPAAANPAVPQRENASGEGTAVDEDFLSEILRNPGNHYGR